MSNCELRLIFDRTNRRYHFGETARGVVQVQVHSKAYCRLLTLDLEWRTHGKGSQDSEQDDSLDLFSGGWEPGRVYQYGFEFTVPSGPQTYHGKYVNVDWYVRARAEDPYGPDALVEQEILIMPESCARGAHHNDQVYLGPTYNPRKATRFTEQVSPSNRTLLGGFFWLTLGALLGTLSVWLFFSSAVSLESAWNISGILAGAIMTWMGGNEILRGFRLRGLGNYTIEFQPMMASPGTFVNCQIRVHPYYRDTVPTLTVALAAQEVATSGSGSATSDYTCTVYQKSFHPTARRCSDGGFAFEARMMVPEDAAATFSSLRNKLAWLVEVKLSAHEKATYERSYPITVCP